MLICKLYCSFVFCFLTSLHDAQGVMECGRVHGGGAGFRVVGLSFLLQWGYRLLFGGARLIFGGTVAILVRLYYWVEFVWWENYGFWPLAVH